MGLFDFVGDTIGGILGGSGGSSPSGYTSPYTGEYESGTRSGIYNRLGAKRKAKTDASGNPIKDDQGNPVYEYDTTNIAKPVSTSEAKSGYSFGGYDKAANNLGKKFNFSQEYTSGYNPTSFTSGYSRTTLDPTKFNYETLPKEYGDLAYNSGAKDIRREGQGQLEKLQETVGVRRPGLLLKASEGVQRGTRESLADLGSKIRLSEMEQGTNLKVQQQKDQAEENYKKAGFDDQTAKTLADEKYKEASFGDTQAQFKAGEGAKEYESRAAKEKAQADENLSRDKAGVDAAGNKINLEADVTESERNYKDKALEYLMDLFKSTAGLSADEASRATSAATARRGQNLGLLGDVASIFKPKTK